MFRVGGVLAENHRVRQMLGLEGLLVAGLAGAQHIQADPAHHGGQPAAEIIDIAGIGAGQPQPRLLHGIVGIGERAEHPVGDRPQMGAVLFETVGQVLLIVHGVLLGFRPVPMTNGRRET
ncbi:Uncharacterised protein [Mycobacteroides abscessus subsp. abscessus]|nr:Uncharacterised protein [Mycobacteroides abscessus subsp. abscessus]